MLGEWSCHSSAEAGQQFCFTLDEIGLAEAMSGASCDATVLLMHVLTHLEPD